MVLQKAFFRMADLHKRIISHEQIMLHCHAKCFAATRVSFLNASRSLAKETSSFFQRQVLTIQILQEIDQRSSICSLNLNKNKLLRSILFILRMRVVVVYIMSDQPGGQLRGLPPKT